MNTYIIVTVDNELVAVVEADSEDEARLRAQNESKIGMAFLCADWLGDKGYYDLRGKATA